MLAYQRHSTFFFSSAHCAASALLLASCSTNTSPSDADAATIADTGAETDGSGGTGGTGDGASDATGKSGAGGAAGNGASGAGSGGTTGGSAGSDAGGGAAGSGRDGQADTASGDRDAESDVRDSSIGPDTNTDRVADTTMDARSDATTDATGSDATHDASQPPSDGLVCLPLPSAGVYATFRVVRDVFYASITNPAGIDQAIALWRGQSQANIPVGQLECSNGTYNCGWSWRMNPASITFAEITIEVCDATPSYVQGNCASFPNAQYCPWSAELIALRDCRTDPSCPTVTR